MYTHVESKDLTVPKLNLTRFYGLDHPFLYQSPDTLDVVREQFAAEITACALHCRNNIELLDALYAAIPPESGFPFPRKLGEGSTRRAFLLPFGLVLKLERTDDLTPKEMAYRGSKSYLQMRRRVANFDELAGGLFIPNAIARIYGCMMAFGSHPVNVNCLIVERLSPLSDEAPDEHIGISNEDLGFCRRTGELLVFDSRFSRQQRQANEQFTFAEVLNPRETGMWLGNIGRDNRGGFRIIDFGNFSRSDLKMSSDYYPMIFDPNGRLNLEGTWRPCGPFSLEHQEQTESWSKNLYQVYRRAFRKEDTHGPEPTTVSEVVTT